MDADPRLRIDVVSIFPEYLQPLRLSLVGKAVESGLVGLSVHDLRDWTHDRHRTVDDTPYGGGAGMVMRPEPWGEVLDFLQPTPADPPADPPAELPAEPTPRPPRLVVLTPSGRSFTQAIAHELAAEDRLIFACGRYEGIDARVVEHAKQTMRVDELSIGDYVLNGGEAAALVIIEAVVRLLPGVIGNPASLTEESHSIEHQGLLEYPLYTKPPSWRGHDVPEVLLSGHHAKIASWRRDQAMATTRARRPDLLPPDVRPPDQHQLLISPAQPADAGELLTLEWAAFVPEGRLHHDIDIPPLTETIDELRAALLLGPFLVARLGSRIVGSVRGQRLEDGYWYVGRLVVAPDLQGRGFGSRLFAAMEALAPADAVGFRLTTGGNSLVNQAFYRRRGYREVSRSGRPDEVPLVTMEKPR